MKEYTKEYRELLNNKVAEILPILNKLDFEDALTVLKRAKLEVHRKRDVTLYEV